MKHRFNFLTLLLVLFTIHKARQRTIVLEYVPIQFPVWNINA